jgi:phosphate starvation-inducible protein PhoH and related proteins
MASKRPVLLKRVDNEECEFTQTQSYQRQVNNSLKIKLDHLRTFEPLTENQAKFFELYRGGAYCIGLFGSPGVGKTFLSLYRSFEEVLDRSNSFKQVVVVRSAVQVRDQGFLPGDLNEKMEMYEQPYVEICETLFGRKDAWERLKEQGYARFISTTAIRGISIDDAIIIVDECQSMTWHELSSVISRTGHRSKIIFVGDLKQNDLVKNKNDVSGLSKFLEVLNTMREYQSIEFTPDDIVRSSLVKSFIVACDNLGY